MTAHAKAILIISGDLAKDVDDLQNVGALTPEAMNNAVCLALARAHAEGKADAEGFLEAAKAERDRWRARYGETADALHTAVTLLRWIHENEEIAFSDYYDATRHEWPLNDNRAQLLREWDRKMDEAKAILASSLIPAAPEVPAK